jgi:hypothetical protein
VDGENRCFYPAKSTWRKRNHEDDEAVMLVMTIAVALFMLIPNLS